MMLVLLFAGGFVSFATADCFALADTQTGNCTAPNQYTSCVNTCSLYGSENPCKAAAGCAWVLTAADGMQCSPTDTNKPGECAGTADSAACGVITGCTWKTTVCKTSTICLSNNQAFACSFTSDATACKAQGAHCVPVFSCYDSNRCDIYDTQGTCTSTTGCFWSEVQTTYGNLNRCSQCFNAPDTTENQYSGARLLAGTSCTVGLNTINISVVVASNTGCSGGVARPSPYDNDTVCVPLPTKPPTPGPAGAPTDNKPSSAVAVSVSVWAVLGAFFLA